MRDDAVRDIHEYVGEYVSVSVWNVMIVWVCRRNHSTHPLLELSHTPIVWKTKGNILHILCVSKKINLTNSVSDYRVRDTCGCAGEYASVSVYENYPTYSCVSWTASFLTNFIISLYNAPFRIMVHTSMCRDLHNFSRTLSPHYTIYSCRLSYTLVCVTTFIISRTSSRTSLTNCISHEHHKDQLPQTSPRTLSSLTNYIIISQRLHPELDLSRTSSWSSLTNSITSHRLHHHISGTSSRISLTNCISHEHHHNHFSRPLSSLTNCVINFSISNELYQCTSV